MTPKEYWHRRAQDWPTGEQNAEGFPERKLSKQEEQKINKFVHDMMRDYERKHPRKNN